MSREVDILLTTFGDRESARRVATTLVDEGLVACAQLDGAALESRYRWKSTLEEDEEWRLTLKIDPVKADQAQARLLELHPYDVPQCIRLAGQASANYARWVRDPHHGSEDA